ncbi:MAG: molybdenum cofactor biosynthesis protein MoaE [Pseudomonadota bacterium]
MRIRVQPEPFDLGREIADLVGTRRDLGAQVSFTGLVRDDNGLEALEIEHYPGMTEKALNAIASEAETRWDLGAVLVIHRYGRLMPGDAIMMVATAAKHRRAAFAAAEFLMDFLKSRAPFWKREITGTAAAWVDAKATDEAVLNRWKDPNATS